MQSLAEGGTGDAVDIGVGPVEAVGQVVSVALQLEAETLLDLELLGKPPLHLPINGAAYAGIFEGILAERVRRQHRETRGVEPMLGRRTRDGRVAASLRRGELQNGPRSEEHTS